MPVASLERQASLQLCCCPSAPLVQRVPFVKVILPISAHPEPSPPLAAPSPPPLTAEMQNGVSL